MYDLGRRKIESRERGYSQLSSCTQDHVRITIIIAAASMLTLIAPIVAYADNPKIVVRWHVPNSVGEPSYTYGDPYGFCSGSAATYLKDAYKNGIYTFYSDGTGTYTGKWYRSLYDKEGGQLLERQVFNVNVVITDAQYNAGTNSIDGSWNESDTLLTDRCFD